jgi:hypothetical protein
MSSQQDTLRLARLYQSSCMRCPDGHWPVVGRHAPKFAVHYQSDAGAEKRAFEITQVAAIGHFHRPAERSVSVNTTT